MTTHNSINHILITVSGSDQVGIAHSVIDTIAVEGIEIIDLGQSSTHGLLSLSAVLKTSLSDDAKKDLQNALLQKANAWNLNLQFETIQGKLDMFFQITGVKMAIDCVSSNRLDPFFLREVTNILKKNGINIYRIDNLSGEIFHSLEIIVVFPSNTFLEQVKNQLFIVSKKYSVDVALIEDNIYRRHKRLIVFDMDSTLIQGEVIDEMARSMGVQQEVSEMTNKAMNAELDYTESLKKRVSLLKGLTMEQMKTIANNLVYSPGVKELISTVRDLGYKIALVSGGFTFFAHHLQKALGIDYIYANELEIVDDKLTGRVCGDIINAQRKADIVEEIALKEKISLKQIVAVGDGANDILMLSKAGLGIAYHAKEVVRKHTSHSMSYTTMNSILYFLGIPKVSHFPNET